MYIRVCMYVGVVGLLLARRGVDGWRGAARRGRDRSGGERTGMVMRVRVYMCESVRARGMGGYSGG